ncbi:glycine--tRNA ligase subunit beta, partial [Francisella tularensis subsp. holarctica]|uniref:glycine--tRNA ligase subunit beta n=1 Tax=Francisella tularensis TaxID=263 RepID=UPI002381D01C
HSHDLVIDNFSYYIKLLADALVIVDWQQRIQMFVDQVVNIDKENDYQVVREYDLVEDVVAIVEYKKEML